MKQATDAKAMPADMHDSVLLDVWQLEGELLVRLEPPEWDTPARGIYAATPTLSQGSIRIVDARDARGRVARCHMASPGEVEWALQNMGQRRDPDQSYAFKREEPFSSAAKVLEAREWTAEMAGMLVMAGRVHEHLRVLQKAHREAAMQPLVAELTTLLYRETLLGSTEADALAQELSCTDPDCKFKRQHLLRMIGLLSKIEELTR